MNIQNLFKLIQIIMTFGGNPLVLKFVDNVVKGTPTQIDNFLWGILRTVLSGGSVNDIEPALAEAQKKYDKDKEEAKKPIAVEVFEMPLG